MLQHNAAVPELPLLQNLTRVVGELSTGGRPSAAKRFEALFTIQTVLAAPGGTLMLDTS